jgi:hypothetical protein
MKFSPHSLLLALLPFFLTSCASMVAISTDPTGPRAPVAQVVLATSDLQPTLTPFQPVPNTPDAPVAPSTFTPIPTFTPAPTEIPTELPTLAPSPTSLPTDVPTIPPNTSILPQYAINVQMDYAGHTVTVSEDVLYLNPSLDNLSNIVLAVNPNLWSGVFSLQFISVNDQPWDDYTLNGQRLTVNLATPLAPAEIVKIGLAFQLTLPYSSARFENFGYTYRQTNLIDWYPFIVPYQAGEWILRDSFGFGETLVYPLADFRVSLTFTDAAQPVVAASAPASSANGALVYILPRARNFTFSISDEYQVSSADANGVMIYNYYFPEHASAAAMTLELTREAVLTYSARFGPYPHSALSVVETDLNDGLEADGLYFLASSFYSAFDGSLQNNLAVISVHETAHQWWYGAVASDQAIEPWLDEALGTYSEHIFYESNYPNLVNWWWNWRVNSRAGGWVDLRVYDAPTFAAYIGGVYFNGANFFEDLRNRIGDEAFFAFLGDYYARKNGQIASSADFFAILDAHTSADYSDLLQNYFYYR